MAFRRTRRNVKRPRVARRGRRVISRVRRPARRVSAVRSVVRREIQRAAETKSVQYGSPYGTSVSFGTVDSASFNPDGIVYVTPGTLAGANIAVGGQEAQRIGNMVRTKKLKMTAMFYPAPYNATTNPSPCPSEVVLWMFKLKPNLLDTIATVNTVCQASFFQSGNGNVGMTGQLDDINYPVNREQVSLLGVKRFKLGFGAYSQSGGSVIYQHFNNNDFKLNHKLVWDITKHCDKRMQWDETGATEPTNRKIWIVMQALRADGTSTTATKLADVNFRFDYDYTDL